jgi:hypothetical protein
MEKTVLGIAAILILLFGIGWAVEGNNFFMYRYFAPKEEAVRRQTFEESKAYNDGMAQELSAMQLDYVKATPEQKAALRSVILHRTAGYDTSRLSPDLQYFVASVHSDALRGTP